MKFEAKDPPRQYQVGLDSQITISDCGRVYLDTDEQLTFVSSSGKEHDFAAKSWGFYATPSVNGRLKDQGFKVALVENSFGKVYVMCVEPEKMDTFDAYLDEEKSRVLEWLDER